MTMLSSVNILIATVIVITCRGDTEHTANVESIITEMNDKITQTTRDWISGLQSTADKVITIDFRRNGGPVILINRSGAGNTGDAESIIAEVNDKLETTRDWAHDCISKSQSPPYWAITIELLPNDDRTMPSLQLIAGTPTPLYTDLDREADAYDIYDVPLESGDDPLSSLLKYEAETQLWRLEEIITSAKQHGSDVADAQELMRRSLLKYETGSRIFHERVVEIKQSFAEIIHEDE